LPSIWKLANGIPTPKPGKNHSEPSNYRPIALTSCVCETIERMINSRIAWFLESNGLLSNIQYIFRQGRSTVDYLVRFEAFIRDAVAKKEHAVPIIFYLEKAYDTTWKYGILKDLFDMGLIGKLSTFISNFLSERSELTYSGIHEQEMGVPEGSILSVTLFSIEINSLAKGLSDNIEGYFYVDDFLIYIRHVLIDYVDVSDIRQTFYKVNTIFDLFTNVADDSIKQLFIYNNIVK
jgi:potassium voltage-gated channel Eag-related subfamily H protein 8